MSEKIKQIAERWSPPTKWEAGEITTMANWILKALPVVAIAEDECMWATDDIIIKLSKKMDALKKFEETI